MEKSIPINLIDKSYHFLLGDYNGNGIMDLFCIKNGEENTEVLILNDENNFQSFLLQNKKLH